MIRAGTLTRSPGPNVLCIIVIIYPVHVLEKETVYMKNNMEIKITEIKNDSTHKYNINIIIIIVLKSS
mgnify:CR=1 FL=1